MNDDNFLGGAAFGMFIAIIITLITLATGSARQTETEIIKHNCAQYNPTSGKFEWLEKADE